MSGNVKKRKKRSVIMPEKKSQKRILLIATGGTIATRMTKDGLVPQMTSQEILACIPEIASICEVDTIQLFNLDSTNICHMQWIQVVSCIQDHYAQYEGFVVTHGTDTMAYTAAALSYMIQESPKPTVITGSQKSIYMKETDGRVNLLNAFYYAISSYASGVHIVFDGKAILGTRARKTRTKSYNAFSSIDYPETARIRDGRVIPIAEENYSDRIPKFYLKLNPNVFVFKLIPGISADIFSFLKNSYDAVIIESFGVGGIPSYGKQKKDFFKAIGDWIQSGKILIMATQVPHEGSDMEVYQVGYTIKEKYELIESYDMTLEAVVAKTMWILGQTADRQQFRTMFYQPVQRDIL